MIEYAITYNTNDDTYIAHVWRLPVGTLCKPMRVLEITAVVPEFARVCQKCQSVLETEARAKESKGED